MKTNLLVIGIDQYSRSNPLNNCVKDVNNVVDVLTDKYEFEKSLVTNLIDHNATQSNIINQLEIFLAKQTPDENLVVLFSGHGDYDDQLDMGYILPIEGAFDDKPSCIPNSTLFNYIKAFNYKHIVLLFDSCFSGSVFTPNRGIIPRPKERLYEIPSKWALTSGRIQLVSDGIAGTNSPFAESLIRNLKDNKEEMISISEISRNVVNDVTGFYSQIPRGEPLQLLGHRGGEFMFQLKIKKVAPKGKGSDVKDSGDELKDVLTTYYEIEEKLEEADNQNKPATANRLIEESNSISNFLKKEIIKVFELQKNEKQVQTKFESLLGKNLIKKLKEIEDIYLQKIAIIKSQRFEEAAALRDKEKIATEEVFKILNTKKEEIKKTLKLTPEDIPYDYSILSLIANLSLTNTKAKAKDYIEDNFINIYFLKLSNDNGYITKYLFKDKFEKFINEVIPTCLNKVTKTEYEDEEEEKYAELGFQTKPIPRITGLEIKKRRAKPSDTSSTEQKSSRPRYRGK